MFKKWSHNENGDDFVSNDLHHMEADQAEKAGSPRTVKTKNTILKGNKLIGNISVSCDLELSGEIEGDITSEQDSRIVIKGTCNGNISTREGSVDIEGHLKGGNITAGSNINISGTCDGGEVKAGGRITVNGAFNGKLEAGEIEIGPNARGTGEIFYKDYISIAKGADIEGQICRLPAELKLIKNAPESKPAKAELPPKKASGS